MPQKFKKGDVVKLKSGGPSMTIEKYKLIVGYKKTTVSENVAICTWFDNDGKLQSVEFEQDSLKLENE